MDVIPYRNIEPPSGKNTIPGLDLLRAVAAIGVVLLHASVPYLRHPMPGLSWAVRDTPSDIIDVVGWTIELFVMPLFLVIAGFLGWQTLRRRGPGGLIGNRAKRLLIPLAFGCMVILPISLHIWVLGWVAEGLVPPVKLRSFKFDGVIDRNLWGTSHLWFLQYLFLYVVSLGALAWFRARVPRPSTTRVPTGAALGALFVAGVAIIAFSPEVVWGFQHSFVPVPSKWCYSGLFFAAGVVLASRDPDLQELKKRAGRWLGPAALITIATVILGRWHLSGGDNPLARATLAILTVSSACALTFSLIGVTAVRVRSVSTMVRYVAAASFWIYLVHHPLVALTHIDLKTLLPGANPLLKFGIAFATSLTVSLGTYEAFVRKTAFGRRLGFAWSPPTPTRFSQEGSADAPPCVSIPLTGLNASTGQEERRAA